MGTKNKPGDFDCYANAEPDEPMFVLLARDPLAPRLVEMWATLHQEERRFREVPEITLPEVTKKEREAMQCAAAMREWRKAHR